MWEFYSANSYRYIIILYFNLISFNNGIKNILFLYSYKTNIMIHTKLLYILIFFPIIIYKNILPILLCIYYQNTKTNLFLIDINKNKNLTTIDSNKN